MSVSVYWPMSVLCVFVCCKIKLFSGSISDGASNEPEVYLESSQTFTTSILAKRVDSYKLLTIFS